jgi:glycosyltransferase involved in cell wall biosynthesis
MRIAVNISGFVKDGFLMELIQRFAESNDEHSILLLSDKETAGLNIVATNIRVETFSPIIKSNISLKYWYDVKLAAAAKKLKADLLINLGSFCSLGTKLPQLLVMDNLDFIHHPKAYSTSKQLFYKLYQKKFFAKAKKIIALNEWIKQELVNQFNIPAEKIVVVPPIANQHFAPINFEQRESIKDGFADGREYFLFINDEKQQQDRMMNLLKAFSLFKKWQQSSMKLLVMGKVDDVTMEKLKTYKHRDDVELMGDLSKEQHVKVLAACYAFLDISFHKGFTNRIAAAFQSGVPVIASNETEIPEMPSGSALHANPTDVEEIANQLKLVYRDEKLRSQLIEKGLLLSSHFSWSNSLSFFQKVIEATASK